MLKVNDFSLKMLMLAQKGRSIPVNCILSHLAPLFPLSCRMEFYRRGSVLVKRRY